MSKTCKCERCGQVVSKLVKHQCPKAWGPREYSNAITLPDVRILILGHARHGKDTVAEALASEFGLNFTSSSLFVAENCIWEQWGKTQGYKSIEEMYEDRDNHRATWHRLIAEYNTPYKTRTATEMFASGHHMYVGMRAMNEFVSCMRINLFTHVLWVQRPDTPNEPIDSFNIPQYVTTDIIINDSNIENLKNCAIKWGKDNLSGWNIDDRSVKA